MNSFRFFRLLLPGLLFLPFIVRAENDGPLVSNVPLNEINVRAYRYFHTTWPVIAGEVWYKTDKEYFVTFRSHSHLKKAFFNLRGYFLCSMEYYSGVDASADLIRIVQDKYPDFQIDVVTEVMGKDRTVFFLTIKNSSGVKNLSVAEGKLTVLEELVNP